MPPMISFATPMTMPSPRHRRHSLSTTRSDNSGMRSLHGGRRDKLEVSPNLWAGVGLLAVGAGTALVGDPEIVAERMREYADLGIETFICSGYPHLEEAYRVAELLFPKLPLSAGSSVPAPHAKEARGEIIGNLHHAPARHKTERAVS